MKARYPMALAMLVVCGSMVAQNTVGLLTNDVESSQDGYTMFYPADQHTVYLIDNCGRLVHTWTDTLHTPSNAVYLLDNGDLLRCGKRPGPINPIMQRGGAGDMVDRWSWSGELLWRYTYNTQTVRMHHDVEPMPNGNVLIIAWEYKTLEEAAAAGMDTSAVELDSVWPDHLIEVSPEGAEGGTIVWEWHAWDHLVQDHDPELPGFGVVSEHPERIDVNYHPLQDEDWMHINSVDYNAELDQILLSVPFFNEVWVIDHSTTTEEAATSSGGNSGRGGDLLYRWGNPMAYGRGDGTDQTLFFQHDAKWLGPGLADNDADQGKMIVFNNRVGTLHSAVDVFAPPVDANGNYTLDAGQAFGPATYDWRYTAPVLEDLFSSGLSSADKLPNGNFFICSGRQGWAFEVDAAGEIVWEYVIPLFQGEPIVQGTEMVGAATFRATKYPADHPFLSQQELTTNTYIELEPDTLFCGSISLAVGRSTNSGSGVHIYPNPARNLVHVSGLDPARAELLDATGKVVRQFPSNGTGTIDVTGLAAGLYVLRIGGEGSALLMVEE